MARGNAVRRDRRDPEVRLIGALAPVGVASFRLHAVDAIANKCHSLWRRTPPRASGMLTIIKAGCDWFSRLRTAGSHAAARVGVVVMATTTGLRMGGFASSAPAALSSRSSGYCERCTLPLKSGRLSRMARIQGGIGGSFPAARTARRAVLARMRRIFRSCGAFAKPIESQLLSDGFSFAVLVIAQFQRFQPSRHRLMRASSRLILPSIVFLWVNFRPNEECFSVGRAIDCRGIHEINWSLVRFRLLGLAFFFCPRVGTPQASL